MSKDRMNESLASALNKQHVSDQMASALTATAQQAATLREALLASGFTRDEAMQIVNQWIQTLTVHAVERRKG